MKRFWDHATVVAEASGFTVALDGKPLRVPEGGVLSLPKAALAEAVAAEWQAAGGARGGEMSTADVPLTRLAGTAQERIAYNRDAVVQELARYGGSDLLCYRAPHPRPLVERQTELWQPWLDWSAQNLNAALLVTNSIAHVTQPGEALAALEAAVAALDPHQLAALGILVPSFGSLVLALAVAQHAMSSEAAFELATLDERFQAEQWGWDREAEDRLRRLAADVADAGRFLTLCGD
jgi:chaperone required for assembly of F1-ATPase